MGGTAGDRNCEVRDAEDNLVIEGHVEEIAHWGVVRDYCLRLEGGFEVLIPARTVRAIIEHENEEGKEQ